MSRPTYIRGEILPPLSEKPAVIEQASDEQLKLIASWLDDRFEIPGIGTRFGLDALIGWTPGIGDALAALALLNLTVESTLGAIPIIGDFAHVVWKANRPNYNLLLRDQQSQRRHNLARLVVRDRRLPNDAHPFLRAVCAVNLLAQVASSAFPRTTESLLPEEFHALDTRRT